MQGVTELPKVQRAWVIERRGKPASALSLRSDWPVPSKLEKGDVLVKVGAAALNPVGYKIMGLLPNFVVKRPQVAEYDLAGTVVNGNDTEFSPGDEVFGMIPPQIAMKTGDGALAQYTKIPSKLLVARPSNISVTDVASITLVATTAYQALVTDAKIEPGQTVFINGGSTSVGAFAIQIAKAKGCKVIASASGGNEELVRSLGADEFFDYTTSPLHLQLKSKPPSTKFHVFFEAVGLIDPSLYTESPAYLAPNGVFITVGPQPHGFTWSDISNTAKTLFHATRPRWLGGLSQSWQVVRPVPKKEDLEWIQSKLANGQLKPVVDSIFPFEDALKAYDRIMSSRARGKVVVTVDDS